MSYVEDLLAFYANEDTAPPEWAYPSHASIPFVGKNYGKWNGILVYASAENLAHYERKPETRPEYFNDDRVHNRHRTAFEYDTNGNFFRHVHMAPFDNGSLLVASSYYIWRQHGEMIEEPVELLESIAVANFCKFSISVTKQNRDSDNTIGLANIDYADDSVKLKHSLPFVINDIVTLEPKMVLMPNSILKKSFIRKNLEEIAPNTTFLGIPQFNSTVVNTHLKKYAPKAVEVEKELENTALNTWIDNLKGYAKGYPYRYLVKVDEVISKM